ncbi:hypothetical protein ASE12_12385 [Aeromicrobium sp. Root236]|nr:hypothetical protein ASE12_12385 [Aeromicrobium sp. Root236]
MVRETEMATNHLVLEELSFGIAGVTCRFDQIVRVFMLRQYGSSVHGKTPRGLDPSTGFCSTGSPTMALWCLKRKRLVVVAD